MRAVRPGAAPGFRPLLASLAVVMMVSASACAVALPNPFDRSGSNDVFLRVENHNWSDMTIFVVRGGARARLGNVTTTQTRTFRLPQDFSTPGLGMAFEADPLGSARVFRSHEISVSGGETWVWVLQTRLEQSSLYIH
jgi:hypothetical protein